MADTNQLGVQVLDCDFLNGVTTDLAELDDIAVIGMLIHGCRFHGIPTDFMTIDNASCEVGMISNCQFNATALAVAEIAIDHDDIFVVGCYTEEGVSTHDPD